MYSSGWAPIRSDRMPRLAMKSAGPKISAASRGEAAAIWSAAASPAASSICASTAMPPGGSPAARSTWPSSRSSQVTWPGWDTLGKTIASRRAPDRSTTSITSRNAHSVVAALILTASKGPGRSRPPCPATAAAASDRARCLAAGATASSRSKISSSAARPAALARNLSLLPGTVRQLRRGAGPGGRPPGPPRGRSALVMCR